MSAIKPKGTNYKGYRFRSRTEARWAVFFDALGIEWDYEKEGYDLDCGPYLPDFWLPNPGLWVEIKGEPPTYQEKQRARCLRNATKKPVLILQGVPRIGSVWTGDSRTFEGTLFGWTIFGTDDENEFIHDLEEFECSVIPHSGLCLAVYPTTQWPFRQGIFLCPTDIWRQYWDKDTQGTAPVANHDGSMVIVPNKAFFMDHLCNTRSRASAILRTIDSPESHSFVGGILKIPANSLETVCAVHAARAARFDRE